MCTEQHRRVARAVYLSGSNTGHLGGRHVTATAGMLGSWLGAGKARPWNRSRPTLAPGLPRGHRPRLRNWTGGTRPSRQHWRWPKPQLSCRPRAGLYTVTCCGSGRRRSKRSSRRCRLRPATPGRDAHIADARSSCYAPSAENSSAILMAPRVPTHLTQSLRTHPSPQPHMRVETSIRRQPMSLRSDFPE